MGVNFSIQHFDLTKYPKSITIYAENAIFNPDVLRNLLRKESIHMYQSEFINTAVEAVVKYFNSEVEVTDEDGRITDNDVYVVWFCKTLQNYKALLSTTVSDGMYYEFTWNGDKNEGYLDAYKKWKNVVYKGV